MQDGPAKYALASRALLMQYEIDPGFLTTVADLLFVAQDEKTAAQLYEKQALPAMALARWEEYKRAVRALARLCNSECRHFENMAPPSSASTEDLRKTLDKLSGE
jgi:hypothetical protein